MFALPGIESFDSISYFAQRFQSPDGSKRFPIESSKTHCCYPIERNPIVSNSQFTKNLLWNFTLMGFLIVSFVQKWVGRTMLLDEFGFYEVRLSLNRIKYKYWKAQP